MRHRFLSKYHVLLVCAVPCLACGEVRPNGIDPGDGGGERPGVDAGGDGADAGPNAGRDASSDRPASAERSSIRGQDRVVADGETTAEIAIELLDETGEGVAGVTPEFAASGQGNTYEACTETGDDGVATCGMSSTEAGDKTLEITSPVLVEGDTIQFLPTCEHGSGIAFGGGSGTADDPYRLCTPAHLEAIGSNSSALDATFVVLNDIDMIEVADFAVIGDDDTPFTGEFDGGGFAIRNLTIDRTDASQVGLFGVIAEGAHIRRAILEDAAVSGADEVGALAGMSAGEIENSRATGSVTGTTSVGGLVGDNRGTIGGASADVTTTGVSKVGGLAGENIGVIANSHAMGRVVGEGSVGGLAGLNAADLSGFPRGSILDAHATGDVSGDELVGGLVGGTARNSGVENSYATGDVDGTTAVGGLVGSHIGRVKFCFATGDVVAADSQVGGLVGRIIGEFGIGGIGTVADSYAVGSASGDTQVGGLVGHSRGVIDNAYAAGQVSGDTAVGGLVGDNEGKVEASFWDEASAETSDGGAPLETAEFAVQSLFEDEAGWDFDSHWTIGEAPDGAERPIFQWQ